MADAKPDAVAYHHTDFCFEEHRRAVEASAQDADAAGPSGVSAEQGGDGTAAAWESFHLQHAAVPFFKQRRYLVAEFPQLAARGEQLTVLELGCGVGSSALPLLLSDPGVRVVACDFAPAAVEAARQAVSRAGLCSRFVAFLADPSTLTAAQFAAALSAAVGAAGWPPLTHVDALLAVFVLSAVPPPRLPAFLASVCACVRPGGFVLVRDYGVYDQAHLRFSPSGIGRLFKRQDGTLARFFELDELRDAVLAGAGGVRLVSQEAEWHTVEVRNRAERISMRRVFVHAVFTRAADGV